jgi:hypothetical protein
VVQARQAEMKIGCTPKSYSQSEGKQGRFGLNFCFSSGILLVRDSGQYITPGYCKIDRIHLEIEKEYYDPTFPL